MTTTRRLSERPEDSSGSLVARITLGGSHLKLQRPWLPISDSVSQLPDFPDHLEVDGQLKRLRENTAIHR